MKENLELEKQTLEQFKITIKEQSILTLEEIQEVIDQYESLIHKIQAYQTIISDIVNQRHIERHMAK